MCFLGLLCRIDRVLALTSVDQVDSVGTIHSPNTARRRRWLLTPERQLAACGDDFDLGESCESMIS